MTKYVIHDRAMAERVASLVAGLDLKKPWSVEVKRYVKQRTLPANNLYWRWLSIIGDHLGYDKDEMHDVMREKFLPVEVVEVCGVRRKKLTSTSDPGFTTADMSAYMDRIDRFAAQELGILLPHPEDQWHEQQQGRPS